MHLTGLGGAAFQHFSVFIVFCQQNCKENILIPKQYNKWPTHWWNSVQNLHKKFDLPLTPHPFQFVYIHINGVSYWRCFYIPAVNNKNIILITKAPQFVEIVILGGHRSCILYKCQNLRYTKQFIFIAVYYLRFIINKNLSKHNKIKIS